MLPTISRVFLVIMIGLLARNTATAQEIEKERHARISHATQVPIPHECLLKAQVLVASASLSSADISASRALVYLLAQTDTRMNVSYILEPQLLQKNSTTGLSELKLQGTFDSLVMNLVGAAGSAYAKSTTRAYKTLIDAQSASAYAAGLRWRKPWPSAACPIAKSRPRNCSASPAPRIMAAWSRWRARAVSPCWTPTTCRRSFGRRRCCPFWMVSATRIILVPLHDPPRFSAARRW